MIKKSISKKHHHDHKEKEISTNSIPNKITKPLLSENLMKLKVTFVIKI